MLHLFWVRLLVCLNQYYQFCLQFCSAGSHFIYYFRYCSWCHQGLKLGPLVCKLVLCDRTTVLPIIVGGLSVGSQGTINEGVYVKNPQLCRKKKAGLRIIIAPHNAMGWRLHRYIVLGSLGNICPEPKANPYKLGFMKKSRLVCTWMGSGGVQDGGQKRDLPLFPLPVA